MLEAGSPDDREGDQTDPAPTGLGRRCRRRAGRRPVHHRLGGCAGHDRWQDHQRGNGDNGRRCRRGTPSAGRRSPPPCRRSCWRGTWMPEAPEELVRLAEQRAQARAAKDFAEADAIRDRIASAGWTVVDEPDGTFRLEPVTAEQEQPLGAQDVASVLDEPATMDVSVHWVCEGWPEDVERAIRAFRNQAGERSAQYVVADVTGARADRCGGDVEALALEPGTGWAAARNAGLRRSRGRIVLAMDGSVE